MLTQAQADRLIGFDKEATRDNRLVWKAGGREDELFVAIPDNKWRFVLSMSRNPFEIRLNFRTKNQGVDLVRLDCHGHHQNPDGTEIFDRPHLHVFREGFGVRWAHHVNWCDPGDPCGTLKRFLEEINARFPNGILCR